MTGPIATTRVKRRPPRSALTLIAIAVALILAVVAVGITGGFRINLSPSEPIGLWRIEPLQGPVAVGDLIFICPPVNEVIREARSRGYLRSGLCPSSSAPLIKTVIAAEGQQVDIGGHIRIDGRWIERSTVARLDGKGRLLHAFSGGVVPAGHVFLHSRFVGSYDSRYFGPIPLSGLLGRARAVLTYAP